jgi:hypothetical protein
MMADRGIKYAVAALGVSVLLTGGVAAEEIWQGYAPRCQPTEVAERQGMTNPCQQQLAVFGLSGPQVFGRDHGMDVEATGSINEDSRRSSEDAGAPQ